jgi:molybdenum cofactor cytidylyltransferase
VLYTDPVNGERARQLFENVTTQRLERFGLGPSFVMSSLEDEASVSRALHHLLRPKPAVIMVASTTAPAGPEDVIGRAITHIGGTLERFLAPVEPGNLFMLAYLAYKDEVPIVSAPGCFRSVKANVMDLVLPPLLARYRVNSWEVAGMGHGGLLG